MAMRGRFYPDNPKSMFLGSHVRLVADGLCLEVSDDDDWSGLNWQKHPSRL